MLWRTTSSYLDGSPRPFLVTRMPVPALVAPNAGRRTRRRVGFGGGGQS
jgi:hypothetical protein